MLIHTEKIRWLFWLRWKLLIRGFTRNKGRIITAIVMLLFMLPLAGSLAAGTFFAYRYLHDPANAAVLFLVLTAVYLLWVVLPLLEYTINEGLDVSKLMLFPLTRAELATSLLFSTLLDIPTLGMVLILAAVVAGWSISIPVALFTVLAVLVFYVQVVGMSQLVLALFMRTLQSRRFRDLSIIIFILVSSSCGLLGQLVAPIMRGIQSGAFSRLMQFATYLQWIPPGMTARSIQQAALGNWGNSVAWLAASLITCVVVLYLWQLVLQRSLTSPEVGGSARTRHRRVERVPAAISMPQQPASAGIWQRIISPQVLAIAGKDLKYLWRDPQMKAMLFQPVVFVIIFVLAPFFGRGGMGTSGLGDWNLMYYPLIVFLSLFTLTYNTLGLERQSLTTLFLFPVDPQRILRGKNLAAFALGLGELVIIVLLGSFLLNAWGLIVPTLAIGLAGMGVVLGCSNFSSVFLPQYMPQMRGFRATGLSSGNGCMRTILTFVMMGVTVVVLLPVAAALVLPVFLHEQWAWTFTVPAALAYGAFFHWLVTRLVAQRMLMREPEILAITTRE